MVLRSDADNKEALKNYVYKILDFFSTVESFYMLSKTYKVKHRSLTTPSLLFFNVVFEQLLTTLCGIAFKVIILQMKSYLLN